MRLATVVEGGRTVVAVMRGERLLLLPPGQAEMASIRSLAAAGPDVLDRVRSWLDGQPADAGRPIDEVDLAPAVPDPGAIFTVGLNYRDLAGPPTVRPERPLVYGKLPTSVAAHRATLGWDRSVTPNVDAECELGVVIGSNASCFGFTIVNDVSSRDAWLDGDQWLLGKSMPGFCPIGPWIVTADELDPSDVALGCTINGEPIQDGRTADMRFSIPEIVAFLTRHVWLEPGDVIATGTPARLAAPPGPDRRLQAGDVVTAWIEGIGELTSTID
jgi:2-keto-4-pentenoate hydratase/2-oxohepta-3-ene-1,7-dioic acid hydratase in catechol pathway